MKKIIFIIMTISITSCSSIEETERSVYITGFDFTKYASKNFLFTTEGYNGEYASVGLLNASIFPSVKKVKDSEEKNPKYYIVWVENSGWIIEKIDPSDAVEEMYKQAIKMGADGVIKFQSQTIYQMNGMLKIPGYEVSGLAIKRK